MKQAPAPVEADSGPRPLPHSLAKPLASSQEVATAESLEDGVTAVAGSATASADESDFPTAAGGRPLASGASRQSDVILTAPAIEPAAVRVVSVTGSDAQWRPIGGVWETVSDGASGKGRFEVRTGLDGELLLDCDGQVEIRIGQLSRVVVERRNAGLRGAAPAITVHRGWVELRAGSAESVECWIRTPDRSAGFATQPGIRVGYNAFSGTSLQTAAFMETRPRP